jgi:hypothetical protein
MNSIAEEIISQIYTVRKRQKGGSKKSYEGIKILTTEEIKLDQMLDEYKKLKKGF